MDEDGKTALSGPVDGCGVGIARTLEKNAYANAQTGEGT